MITRVWWITTFTFILNTFMWSIVWDESVLLLFILHTFTKSLMYRKLVPLPWILTINSVWWVSTFTFYPSHLCKITSVLSQYLSLLFQPTWVFSPSLWLEMAEEDRLVWRLDTLSWDRSTNKNKIKACHVTFYSLSQLIE